MARNEPIDSTSSERPRAELEREGAIIDWKGY